MGGVRVNWDEVNALLKKKLYFVHLSFSSDELAGPPDVVICDGKDTDPDLKCHEPVDPRRYYNEERALRLRLKLIPTSFGLSRQQQSDIAMYVKLLFNPENACLMHLRDLVTGSTQHTSAFYEIASNSCDDTPSFTDGDKTRRRNLEDIFGDWIPSHKEKTTPMPTHEEQPYVPLSTIEAREAFWNEVLKYYGWNGTEVHRAQASLQ